MRDRDYWMTPSAEIRSVQGRSIGIDLGHDGVEVGEVVFIERDRQQRLWLVGYVRDGIGPYTNVKVGSAIVPVETPAFWSLMRSSTQSCKDIEILSVALTKATARISPQPVMWLRGWLDHRAAAARWKSQLRPHEHEMLTRAAVYHRERQAGTPLIVRNQDTLSLATASTRATTTRRIETRSATVADVHDGLREIDVVVSPAESPTIIYERGKKFLEVFSHGAFDGVQDTPSASS
jgi:hypothetical protein